MLYRVIRLGLKEKIYAAIRAGIKTVIIPEDNRREIVEFDKDIIKAVKIISVSEATAILKYTLTKPVIPLNLNESDITRTQKSNFEADNLKENLTH